ncbi:DUF2363 domain-containing protein [archaeon]|nr:MAG: DUF2363 domain-containing protein [archaeon]
MLLHNSSLVQEVVVALSALRSPLTSHFLSAFLSTPATTDNIEAVRSIMNQKCNLPGAFLPQFVSHCVESSYSTLDPAAQVTT